MDDREIIELLFLRTESALDEISRKYSHLYMGIIKALIDDSRDAEECANDVLLAVWNSIPPNKPDHLSAYVCKLARRIGIDRFRHNTVGKRNGTYVLTLDELEECIASTEGDPTDGVALREALDRFLREQPAQSRIVFLQRYWYFRSIKEIAKDADMSENAVKVMLHRVRERLKAFLEKEGIII